MSDMSRTLTDVLVKRERLLAQCAQQRDALAVACRGLVGPAVVVDRLVPSEATRSRIAEAVELALRARDVEFVRAKVGDRYVLEELVSRGWQLGGEGSGDLIALDRHTTGDGIVFTIRSTTRCTFITGLVTVEPSGAVTVSSPRYRPWMSSTLIRWLIG